MDEAEAIAIATEYIMARIGRELRDPNTDWQLTFAKSEGERKRKRKADPPEWIVHFQWTAPGGVIDANFLSVVVDEKTTLLAKGSSRIKQLDDESGSTRTGGVRVERTDRVPPWGELW